MDILGHIHQLDNPRLTESLNVNRQRIGTSLYAGLLFTILGGIAWRSGEPFIFPSLGPTAFILAFERKKKRTQKTRTIGSHIIGGIAGLFAYSVLGGDASLTATISATSIGRLQLAVSGVLSIILTSWGMIATDTIHPPACATTLIVSLGLLSSPRQVAIMIASVVVLVGFHSTYFRISRYISSCF